MSSKFHIWIDMILTITFLAATVSTGEILKQSTIQSEENGTSFVWLKSFSNWYLRLKHVQWLILTNDKILYSHKVSPERASKSKSNKGILWDDIFLIIFS